MPVHANQSLGASAAASASPAIPLNQYAVPFNVGFGLYTIGAGDATAHVEHCFDKVVSAATVWFDHVDVSGATTVSASSPIDGNYAYPISHVRFELTAVSGTPVTHFVVLQTGV